MRHRSQGLLEAIIVLLIWQVAPPLTGDPAFILDRVHFVVGHVLKGHSTDEGEPFVLGPCQGAQAKRKLQLQVNKWVIKRINLQLVGAKFWPYLECFSCQINLTDSLIHGLEEQRENHPDNLLPILRGVPTGAWVTRQKFQQLGTKEVCANHTTDTDSVIFDTPKPS